MLVVTNTLLNRVWQMWNVWHMNSLDIAKRLEITEPQARKLVEMARNRERRAQGIEASGGDAQAAPSRSDESPVATRGSDAP